jgi:hypothetical protein
LTGIAAVSKEMLIDFLCCLRDAAGRKHSYKWRTYSWVHLHENAAIHWSVLIKDFVAKYNLTTHEHSPYSSDLTPADFYLFP